jgi:hypothetical protein
MVLEWLSGSEASVEDLIAKKKYKKAIEVLKGEFQKGNREPRLRQQLADVLILAGRGKEAVPILAGLGDEYARAGWAAKAIAVLKRLDKIDPGRSDVAKKLAALIEGKQNPPPAAPHVPQDFREIAIALPPREAPLHSSWDPSAPPPPEDELELPAVALPTPAAPAPAPEPAPPRATAVPPPPAASAEPLEVQELLDDDLDLSLDTIVPDQGAAQAEVRQSPLFSNFSQGELLAVMGGLDLLSFDVGDVIIVEGEQGTSLFVLTTGRVKAFVRGPSGRHVLVREMGEGDFFGEIGVLTGGARTATVTAATRVELLELDRKALDKITTTHPRVRQVLETFWRERAGSLNEALAREGTSTTT